MGDELLRNFMETATRQEFDLWYMKQVARVILLRKGFKRRWRVEFIEDHPEVVNETISRIFAKHQNYKRNGVEDLDAYFINCLKTTINSFGSKHRRSSRVHVSVEEIFEAIGKDCGLNSNTADTEAEAHNLAIRMRQAGCNSKLARLVENLPRYIRDGLSQEQIADDLKVKVSSLGQYRTRAYRTIMKLSQSGEGHD